MKRYFITRANGNLAVVHPARKELIQADIRREKNDISYELSDEEYEKIILDRMPKDATDITEIAEDENLDDREFRDAWVRNGNRVGFDLDKAKDIQLGRVREAREPKLSALDIEFNLALEQGDTEKQKEVAVKKQELRDITEPLKNLTPLNIDDVKNSFPQSLKEDS